MLFSSTLSTIPTTSQCSVALRHPFDTVQPDPPLLAPPTQPPHPPSLGNALVLSRLATPDTYLLHSLPVPLPVTAVLGEAPPQDALPGEKDFGKTFGTTGAAGRFEAKQAEDRAEEDAREVEGKWRVEPCEVGRFSYAHFGTRKGDTCRIVGFSRSRGVLESPRVLPQKTYISRPWFYPARGPQVCSCSRPLRPKIHPWHLRLHWFWP